MIILSTGSTSIERRSHILVSDSVAEEDAVALKPLAVKMHSAWRKHLTLF